MARKNKNEEVAAIDAAVAQVVTSQIEHVNPFSIPVPDNADPLQTGRAELVDDAAIFRLAESLVERGQLQPIKVDDGGVIYGASRLRAAQKIVHGFTNSAGQFYRDDTFTLQVIRVPGNLKAKERFLQKLDENVKRNDLTLWDEAVLAQTLKDEYKQTKTEIAARFGYDNTNRVAGLLRLQFLDAESVALVKAGKLALDPALKLIKDVDAADRTACITYATEEESGRVLGSKIGEFLRNKRAEAEKAKEEANQTPAGGSDDGAGDDDAAEGVTTSQKRTLRDVATFFEYLKNLKVEDKSDTEQKIAALRRIGEKFSDWLSGEIATERPLYAAFDLLYNADRN